MTIDFSAQGWCPQDTERRQCGFVQVKGIHHSFVDGLYTVVHDVGTRVWISAPYSVAYNAPGVLRVGDTVTNGFDMDGCCIISVPAAWCTFITETDAWEIAALQSIDEQMLAAAR